MKLKIQRSFSRYHTQTGNLKPAIIPKKSCNRNVIHTLKKLISIWQPSHWQTYHLEIFFFSTAYISALIAFFWFFFKGCEDVGEKPNFYELLVCFYANKEVS